MVSNYDEGRKTKNAPISTIYNRIQQPSWLLWLAEASGVDRQKIRKAEANAVGDNYHQTETKEIRKVLTWALISQHLQHYAHLAAKRKRDGDSLSSKISTDSVAGSKSESKSSSAARASYVRYMTTYEIAIVPAHDSLQSRFESFVRDNGAQQLRPNIGGVDLRYIDAAKGHILAEVKPCDRSSARFAIRTAMGQLLDYQQNARERTSLLIVIQTEPLKADQRLATDNGFGIAYPAKSSFKVIWPPDRSHSKGHAVVLRRPQDF
ncbi:hypothetical protein JQ615_25350 [Bradyrhizobium jicamae]|uniref:Uncharacterized protein n=1 Tax=Bradyrhizobium jicamae TaxID=280332 RepID=A0ABS5FPK8_9BRAD|nr:hypothetical protein [Bradyrhizobium jicamae]MBR0798718.1 hypothetical protein [Bradyrhizobium jicamae]